MRTILPFDEKLTECIGCGSDRISLKYSNDVNECQNCGLLFRNPRPSQATILDSYNQGETYTQWESEKDWRDYMWTDRSNFIRKLTTGNRLLDVGTGDGTFLDFAKTKGFSVEGTEASENGATRAAEKGHTVHLGELAHLKLKGPYDIVTMWHVLEHVPFPGETLSLINSLLDKNGILVIAVPNELNPILKSKFSGGQVQPFYPLHQGHEIHLSHFTPSSLKRLLTLHGFDITHVDVDYSFPLTWSLRDFRNIFYKVLARVTGSHPACSMVLIGRKRS